jgi:flavin-dependent dehydrogenase
MVSGPDLLVVGAGPAGAAIAALAATDGARVTLLDRDRFPRDKVCGEFLSAEGCGVVSRLGVLHRLVAAGAPRLRSCRISAPGGLAVDLPLPLLPGAGAEARGISRRWLDAALVELAAARGAEVLERTEALGPILEDGRVRGLRLREVGGGRTSELRAPLVVAADGRRSVLVRSLHPRLGEPRRGRPRSRFGLKAHYAVADARLEGRVELHLVDGGYVGLAPVENGRWNLCAQVTRRALRAAGSPDGFLAACLRSHAALADRLGRAERCSPWKSVGPLRHAARRPAAHGVLFVGDAAGTIDPFCGEGMSNALCAAELALPLIGEALSRGGLDAALERRWSRTWHAAFGPVTRRVRIEGALLERPALAGVLLRGLAAVGRRLLPGLVTASRTGVV